MAYFWGNMTYYSSCKLASNNCSPCNNTTCKCGACGTCRADEGGIAYPYVTGFPGDYQSACGHCTGCAMPKEPCGTYIGLYNTCNNSGLLYAPIVDHGPGAACTLEKIQCASTLEFRLLDLTPVTYGDLDGSFGYGRLAGYLVT